VEAPRIQDMFEDYEEQGLMVLGVGYLETIQSCTVWKNFHYLTHPVLSDPTGSVTLQYVPSAGGVYLPHSTIIDPNHIVRFTQTGFDDSTARHVLDSLMVEEISISPTHLSFGTVGIGAIYRRYFSIDNTGLGTLEINGITASDPVFTMYPTSGDIVAYDDSLIVGVTFAPTESILYGDTLWVQSSAGEAMVTVGGMGTSSVVTDLTIIKDSLKVALTWSPIYGAQGYYVYADAVPDVETILANRLGYTWYNSYVDSSQTSRTAAKRYYRVSALFMR
jgi:hypothetical protein